MKKRIGYGRIRKRRKGQKIVQSKKIVIDGIEFASILESYCYKKLKEHGIKADYEKRSFEIFRGCSLENDYYANWGGRLLKRQKKVTNIKYTPDFEGDDFIIEVKGRKNERYPVIIKLFRKWNDKNLKKDIYEPKSKDQIDDMIKIIKQKYNL